MNDRIRFLLWCVFGALIVLVSGLVSGCSHPRVKAGGASAVAPVDPGTPALASSGSSVATVPLPAGSSVETVPGTAATPSTPASPPSVKVTLAAPSELRVETHGEASSTGTVDTTVAMHRITTEQAAADRKPLLWVAIGCGVAGILARALVKEWPAIGNALLGAAALAAVAWKVSEVPWWAFAAFLAVVAVGIAFYKRAEWDANGNGVPDALEGKRK